MVSSIVRTDLGSVITNLFRNKDGYKQTNELRKNVLYLRKVLCEILVEARNAVAIAWGEAGEHHRGIHDINFITIILDLIDMIIPNQK